MAARAVLLGLVLFSEKFILSSLVNESQVHMRTGLETLVMSGQQFGYRFILPFAAFLGLFAYARDGHERWAGVSAAVCGMRMRFSRLSLHALLVLSVAALTVFLYNQSNPPSPFAVISTLRLLLVTLAALTLLTGLAPWTVWQRAMRNLGKLWLYAGAAAAAAVGAVEWSQRLWKPTAAVTFDLVRGLLAPIIGGLQADPQMLILRSSHFSVKIAPACSGLEGVGLLLAFCGAWLLCFRREYLFPRALVLLPAAIALSFSLNVVRIASLMIIGYAGFPGVAVYGFHSQAGWIAFTSGALLIAAGSRRCRWISLAGEQGGGNPLASAQRYSTLSSTGEHISRWENPTANYLLPLMAVLALGILARTLSSGFETLYALRPIGAVIAVALGWPRLRQLDWRFSWRGPAVGVLIFAIWIFASRLLTLARGMPPALASMPAPARLLWIGTRAAAAIITVPVAEELAFRGYLMRRVVAADFDLVRFRSVGATGLLASALLFGAEHGALWLPGIIAGLAYGGVLLRTERMGEAVVAHGTTNALLAFYVLHWGQWQLW